MNLKVEKLKTSYLRLLFDKLNSSNRTLLKKDFLLLGSFCLLTVAFLAVSLTIPYNSDHASIVLEAQSILEGNPLLRGWTIGSVPYYSTEMPYYVLGVLLVGFTDKVIYLISALNYALLVLAIIYVSSTDETGRFFPSRALISLCLAMFVAALFKEWGLLSPVHIVPYTYVVICLIGLRAIERTEKPIAYASYAFFLMISMIGDSSTIFVFALPVILVLVVRLLGDQPKLRYTITLIVTLVSIILSKVILYLIELAGGFRVPGVNSSLEFVDLPILSKNTYLFFQGILDLFSIDLFGKPVFSLDSMIAIIHLFGLLVFILAIVSGIRRYHEHSWIHQILVVAIVLNLVEYWIGNVSVNRATVRYLLPALVFGIILATDYITQTSFFKRKPILVYLSCIILGFSLVQPISFSRPTLTINNLGPFLMNKGLKQGYGAYWNASNMTVYTHGEVAIRPVISPDGIKIQPYRWVYEEEWFDSPANFVVIDSENTHNISVQTALNTFGEPDKTYNVDKYTVLVWNRDISLDLRPSVR